MASTPTTWLEDFIVNTVNVNNQGFETVTTLANGNLLVTWTTPDDSGAASPNGTDIIGQMFDAFGNPVGTQFRLNTSFSVDDERDGEVTALPNGGFIIVYEDDEGTDTSLRLQEFNAEGIPVSAGTTIASDTDGLGSTRIADPVVAAASDTSVMIAYERRDSGSQGDIVYKIYNPTTNSYSVEQPLMSNNGIFSLDEITVLSNGNYVVVGSPNEIPNSVKMRIVDSQGNNVLGVTSVGNTGTNGAIDFDADVTALKGGGFVVAWRNVDSQDTDVRFQRYTEDGVKVGPIGDIATGSATNISTFPTVVGLDDGGFLVIYSDGQGFFDATRIERIDANGNKVGETYDLSLQTGTVTKATLMTDGRVAIVWSDDDDIHMEILDPRDGVVNVDVGDGITVAGLDDTIINGSAGNDNIVGLDGDDTISGGNGEDVIDGRNGDDTLTGGNGNDTIRGGNGRDNIKGGGGVDIINAGSGNDIIEGGLGTDTIRAGTGNDTIIVREGEFYDNVDGESGFDTLDHSDTVRSGTTFDFLNETITGAGISGSSATLRRIEQFQDGDGSNTIISDGFGEFFGNGGNDLMVSNVGIEFMDGGSGTDIIDHTSFAGDYSFNMATGLTNINGEEFINFENAIMGAGNDTVIGTAANNIIVGNGGNDNLDGGAGNDVLDGNDGNDTLSGGTGNDALNGGNGQDLLFGGDGSDSLNGGAGNDDIRGNDGVDFLNGGDGNDALNGGANDDFVNGDAGNDVLKGSRGNDTVNGGDGDDRVSGNNGHDILNGGDGNDVVRGGRGNDIIEGGAGDDLLMGHAGRDTFVFNSDDGNDTIRGFKDGADKLDLSGFGFTSVAAALSHFSEIGSGSDNIVGFDFDGTTIEIQGIDLGDLSGADIII